MGTRSRIGILEPDGTVTYIYCHLDGYMDHHGPILLNHYKSEEKVRALIVLGGISRLGEEIGEKHDFDNPPKNTCNVYGRDRGQDILVTNDTIERFCSGLAYLFDPATSSWMFYDGDKALSLWFELLP